MARQQARRQHRERLAGAVLAVLGAVVLVVAIVAIAEPKDNTNSAAASPTSRSSTTPTPSSTPTRTTTSARPAQPSKSSGPTSSGASRSLGSQSGSVDAAARKTPIVVLNNTTRGSLAMQAADRFRAAGWTVSDTGNLTNDIVSTCAYYDPSSTGAQKAAEALQREFPTIKRVEQKFPGLPSGAVVVVLTPDYSSN
ncbi:MAG: LytR C-terminal domain-containing protein [Jatrophihabitans sp.]